MRNNFLFQRNAAYDGIAACALSTTFQRPLFCAVDWFRMRAGFQSLIPQCTVFPESGFQDLPTKVRETYVVQITKLMYMFTNFYTPSSDPLAIFRV